MKSIVEYINEGKRWDKFKKDAKNFWYDICTIVDGTAASMGIVCDKLDDYTSETNTIKNVQQALTNNGVNGTRTLVEYGYVCHISDVVEMDSSNNEAKIRRAFETDGHFKVFAKNKDYAWFVPGVENFKEATGIDLYEYDEEDIVKSCENS